MYRRWSVCETTAGGDLTSNRDASGCCRFLRAGSLRYKASWKLRHRAGWKPAVQGWPVGVEYVDGVGCQGYTLVGCATEHDMIRALCYLVAMILPSSL